MVFFRRHAVFARGARNDADYGEHFFSFLPSQVSFYFIFLNYFGFIVDY